MEFTLEDFIAFLWMVPAAYLIGSIPTAVWIGKAFHNVDVREHGSGNAGATNVMRVLGVRTGIPVLFIDMVKGWLAVSLAIFHSGITPGNEAHAILSIVLGSVAVVGHIFPIFAQFRGGKGVATIAGVCFGLHPLGTLSAFGVFVLVLLIWKYVSLGSITAGLSFPLWVILVYRNENVSLLIFSIAASLILVFTHRRNIQRLIKGEEGRATFLFRKRSEH